MLAAALGGRVAEEIVFGQLTTGAGSDIEQATNIARQMVTRYGMSEKLGPRTFGKREDMVFLGREISEQRDYSDKVAEQIDAEVHDIIDTAYNVADEVIRAHLPKLRQLAEYLIEYETIEVDELDTLWETPPPDDGDSPGGETPPDPDSGDDLGSDPDASPPPISTAPPAPAPAGD